MRLMIRTILFTSWEAMYVAYCYPPGFRCLIYIWKSGDIPQASGSLFRCEPPHSPSERDHNLTLSVDSQAGYYLAGNEPSFQTPVGYHYANHPAQSVDRVREVVFDNFGISTYMCTPYHYFTDDATKQRRSVYQETTTKPPWPPSSPSTSSVSTPSPAQPNSSSYPPSHRSTLYTTHTSTPAPPSPS